MNNKRGCKNITVKDTTPKILCIRNIPLPYFFVKISINAPTVNCITKSWNAIRPKYLCIKLTIDPIVFIPKNKGFPNTEKIPIIKTKNRRVITISFVNLFI